MLAPEPKESAPHDPGRLVELARALIARGELPAIPFAQVTAGPGNRKPCRLCQQPIEPKQVRYRVQEESSRLRQCSFTFTVTSRGKTLRMSCSTVADSRVECRHAERHGQGQ